MYLTAHHVKARDGSTGINAYFSRHALTDASTINWEQPDITAIVDGLPTEVVVQSIEIKPGGNAVLSYLDVVAPEGTEPTFLFDSLRMFEHYVREGHFPATWSSRRVALRFGLTVGMQKFAVAEFRRLRARALLLLGITSESKTRNAASRLASPIRIEVTKDKGGETYKLTADSAARVSAVRPEFGPAIRIRISDDTKEAFLELVGELYPHVVSSLTGLSDPQIVRLGGAEVVDGDRVLWRLDATLDANTFLSAEVPGQILGVWIRHSESPPRVDQAPTGAILPRHGSEPDAASLLALDLVQVQDVWLPLSEAGVHTYSHAAGLVGTERWAFVTKAQQGLPSVIFDAVYSSQKLSPSDIETHYGRLAADRARADRQTMELQLLRRRG